MTTILQDFERMYTGYPEDNQFIYEAIADRRKMDVETVVEIVLLTRYEDCESLEETLTTKYKVVT